MLAEASLALGMASLVLLALVYREVKRCRQIVAAYDSRRILEELKTCCKGLEELRSPSSKGAAKKAKVDTKTSAGKTKESSEVEIVLDLNDPAVRQVYEYYLRVYGSREGRRER